MCRIEFDVADPVGIPHLVADRRFPFGLDLVAEQNRPGGSFRIGIGGPPHGVAPVPAVHACNDEGIGIPGVERNAAIAEEIARTLARIHRRDLLPGRCRRRRRIITPDSPVGHAIGTAAVGIRQIEEAGRTLRRVVREHAGRLAGDGSPGSPAIGAPVEIGRVAADSGIKGLAGAARTTAAPIHQDKGDADVLFPIGEARHLAPGSARIIAPPQPVSARTVEKSRRPVRIDGQALSS